MWGLNKNTPFVLVPKGLISTTDLHDFASGFTPKLLYQGFMRFELYKIDTYDYFIILFLKLRIYVMSCILLS